MEKYMVPDNTPKSPLISFWNSLTSFSSFSSANTLAETSFSSFASCEPSYRQSAQALNWMVENRGGLAKIAGFVIVPAQFIANNHTLSHEIINANLENGLHNGYLEKITFPVGGGFIEGVICYPTDWKKEDNSRCILYHNPNGVATSGFFEESQLVWTPGKIFEMRNCPIILYDYRGVGLNQDVSTDYSSFVFRPTYETIVADGEAALEFALTNFQRVEVMGSSLGGGVATTSLDRHLIKIPQDNDRIIQLINHDSFTTTPRVVFPNKQWVGDILGYVVGAKLNAMTSMQNLIERGLKVTVLYHEDDPVIPFGARMGDFVQTIPNQNNTTVFASPRYGHANLSKDMLEVLKR